MDFAVPRAMTRCVLAPSRTQVLQRQIPSHFYFSLLRAQKIAIKAH